MPLWHWTNDPLWAIGLITVIELLGFGPTLRKTYRQPFSESMMYMVLLVVRNMLVIASLESCNTTTVLFPAAMAAACVGLCVVMLWRRQRVTSLLPNGVRRKGVGAGAALLAGETILFQFVNPKT